MIDPTELTIQIGSTLIGLLSTIAVLKADLRNLTGWVKSIDQKLDATSNLAAELKGKMELMPMRAASGNGR